MSTRHPTLTTTFIERAEKTAHPLGRYLLRLMDLKASNLCLSADVQNARDLLHLADKVGPAIVVLKTHYDIIAGWDYNPHTGTGARLASLARKHGFLIFEDRKFCDIGKTVQMQYTGGTARIIEWAHITNVNMDAGKDVIGAMAEAAARWRERSKYEFRTSVTVGTPVSDSFDESEEADAAINGHLHREDPRPPPPPPPQLQTQLQQPHGSARTIEGRKGSIVSITTVTQSYEPADSPRLSKSIAEGDDVLFPGIEEAPPERGLLILAQMSSAGNLMSAEYTRACVEAARENRGFVMGFVSQESLNAHPDDTFLHMTPGCKLAPEEEEDDNIETAARRRVEGDGLGQQYNTPARLVGLAGTDIVIVGRGITSAGDPQSEAERYRRTAWKAYLTRLQ